MGTNHSTLGQSTLTHRTLFNRSIVGRFRQDASLDRATHLKEVQERRAARIKELDERDERIARCRQDNDDDNKHNASSSGSEDVLQAILDAEEEARLLRARQPAVDGPDHTAQSPPPSARKYYSPRRPPAGAAGIGSPTRPNGPVLRENRQAANDRAVEVYSAGAATGSRRSRPPRRSGSTSPRRPRSLWNGRWVFSAEGRRATAPAGRRSSSPKPSFRRDGQRKVQYSALAIQPNFAYVLGCNSHCRS